MSKQRFVLDTNLVVSAALLEHSFTRQVFETALAQGEILVSDETQDELTEVIMRPKFDRYVSAEKRLTFLANFLNVAIPLEIIEQVAACRDPKDDKFLTLAVNGSAACIITYWCCILSAALQSKRPQNSCASIVKARRQIAQTPPWNVCANSLPQTLTHVTLYP